MLQRHNFDRSVGILLQSHDLLSGRNFSNPIVQIGSYTFCHLRLIDSMSKVQTYNTRVLVPVRDRSDSLLGRYRELVAEYYNLHIF